MNKRRNEAFVGMFVLLGFVFLTLMVFFVSGVYLFRAGYTLNVRYDYVSILDKGAPVRMAGVRVGEVSAVVLLPSSAGEPTRVQVQLYIEKSVQIRKNYVFKIEGTHILSEPHIEITPLPGSEELLKSGDIIEGASPLAVEKIMEHANEITENLNDILKTVKGFVNDKQAGQDVREMISHLAKVSASLNKILDEKSEKDMKTSLENLKESTDDLKTVLDRLEGGKGTAGRLLKDEALYDDMRGFVAEIKAHPWRLLKRDGERRHFLFF